MSLHVFYSNENTSAVELQSVISQQQGGAGDLPALICCPQHRARAQSSLGGEGEVPGMCSGSWAEHWEAPRAVGSLGRSSSGVQAGPAPGEPAGRRRKMESNAQGVTLSTSHSSIFCTSHCQVWAVSGGKILLKSN